MSGVSITESGPNVDLAAILAGGEHLQTRIAQLKAAHDAAARKVAEAQKAEDVAAGIIDDAKAQAEQLIADAKKGADEIIAAAEARRKVFDDDLAAIKASLWERVDAAAKSVA